MLHILKRFIHVLSPVLHMWTSVTSGCLHSQFRRKKTNKPTKQNKTTPRNPQNNPHNTLCLRRNNRGSYKTNINSWMTSILVKTHFNVYCSHISSWYVQGKLKSVARSMHSNWICIQKVAIHSIHFMFVFPLLRFSFTKGAGGQAFIKRYWPLAFSYFQHTLSPPGLREAAWESRN